MVEGFMCPCDLRSYFAPGRVLQGKLVLDDGPEWVIQKNADGLSLVQTGVIRPHPQVRLRKIVRKSRPVDPPCTRGAVGVQRNVNRVAVEGLFPGC